VIASLRADTLKIRKRWANWILFGILLVFVLLFGYVLTYVILRNPPPNFQSPVPASVLKREVFPENLLPNVLGTTSTIGAAIMIILGSLSTASEYGWLTVQTILIQKPGRTAVLGGKLLALAIVTLLISVMVLGLGALTSSVLLSIDGSSSSWPSATTLLKGFGVLWLETAVWTGFGMFLGIAFRSTAAAIGGGMTYLFVGEALIAGLLRNTEVIREVLRFLPGVNASAVNAAFPLTYRSPNAVAQLVDATRGTITLIAYLALFVVAGIIIFRRRDVGGG
jgi:ABC-2 type transport system permease protein